MIRNQDETCTSGKTVKENVLYPHWQRLGKEHQCLRKKGAEQKWKTNQRGHTEGHLHQHHSLKCLLPWLAGGASWGLVTGPQEVRPLWRNPGCSFIGEDSLRGWACHATTKGWSLDPQRPGLLLVSWCLPKERRGAAIKGDSFLCTPDIRPAYARLQAAFLPTLSWIPRQVQALLWPPLPPRVLWAGTFTVPIPSQLPVVCLLRVHWSGDNFPGRAYSTAHFIPTTASLYSYQAFPCLILAVIFILLPACSIQICWNLCFRLWRTQCNKGKMNFLIQPQKQQD